MHSRWKKLFITVAVLFVISLTFGGGLSFKKIADIEARLDSLKSEESRMASSYAAFRQQINVRAGKKEDGRLFITPDDPAVAARVKELVGSYSEDGKQQWADYERMSRWVWMNIEYDRDTYTPILPETPGGAIWWVDDFWRMPAETLKDAAGDCEDVSALLASMILNYNERRFPVWLVGIATREPDPRGHIGLAFPVANRQITIIDPTGKYQSTFPIGWGINADDIPVALDKWLAHWEKKMPGAYVYTVVSEDTYMEFSSNQEFINWVNGYYDK